MSESEQRISEALAEYLREGDLDAVCRRYPDVADELRNDVDALRSIDGALAEEPAGASFPQRLSGCRILGEIGAGGMGRVLLAEDEDLGRKVAIKMMSGRHAGDPVLRMRFRREARAMAQLSHPNIARIYRLGPEDEPPHFVMEFIDGAHLTAATRALGLRRKIELFHKVTLAVEFLHRNHIIHRDLKPANILVGADLEPRLLDFGLALPLDDSTTLTVPGEVMGTPAYFAPEQSAGSESLGPAGDVFSLGAILYELLTGRVPFSGSSLAEQIRRVREEDPELPRRIDPALPGDLQNICLKALEKDPAARYASAREFAADLERYLAGEPVSAFPAAYTRLISGKIELHLRELAAWWRDHLVSDTEYDRLRKGYDALNEREDSWIMEMRRLTPAQVGLYFGAWLLAIGAALAALFRHSGLDPAASGMLTFAAAAITGYYGLRLWNRRQLRTGVAWLLCFSLIVPLAALVVLRGAGWAAAFTRGDRKLELFEKLAFLEPSTNAQLWWAALASLPVYLALRRHTRSPVFSLVFATMLSALAGATLLRAGLIEWIDKYPGRPWFALMPFALLFLAIGVILERSRRPDDSRHFYPFAVVFTLAAFSGVALLHEPYARWLRSMAPWTRGQVEYLFIGNALIYAVLQWLCERFRSPQMRRVAHAFRFVIPGNVLTSLLLLSIAAAERAHGQKAAPGDAVENRIWQLVLPLAASVFVFSSIPKQMKNYLAMGLLFLAIGAVRLQQDLWKDRGWWPAVLMLAGLLLMSAAVRYPQVRLAIGRVGQAARRVSGLSA